MILIDICGTLYNSNTTMDFCEFRCTSRKKRFFLKLIKSLPSKFLNKIFVKVFNYDFIRLNYIKTLSSQPILTIESEAESFVDYFLIGKKITEVHSLLGEFKKEHVVLVSATIEPVAKAISIKLGVNNFYSTTLKTHKGCYTGHLECDLLGRKQEIFKDEKISLVITDNKSDYELCKRADSVIIVSRKKNLSFWKNAGLKIKKIIEV